MARQNIYDDEVFFSGYKKIRDNQVNANNLFEIPALFSMMPELKEKEFWIWDADLENIVKRSLIMEQKKSLGLTYLRRCWKWQGLKTLILK